MCARQRSAVPTGWGVPLSARRAWRPHGVSSQKVPLMCSLASRLVSATGAHRLGTPMPQAGPRNWKGCGLSTCNLMARNLSSTTSQIISVRVGAKETPRMNVPYIEVS